MRLYTNIGFSASALRSVMLAMTLMLLQGAPIAQPVHAAAVFADGNGCNTNDSTAPCFAQNKDILSGQRSLLPVDDIVLTFPTQGTTIQQTVVKDFILDTTSAAVSNQSTLPIVTADCGLISPWTPQVSAVGRMFHLPNDVVVTLSPTDKAGADCSQNSNNMGLYVKDPQNADNDSTTIFTDLPVAVQIAMGDFNRDGYQDIFFINSKNTQVFTAKCPGNPFGSCTEQPSDGLIAGPKTPLTNEETPAGAPAVGDFNGDGVLDVAWPSSIPTVGEPVQISLASVCPAAGAEVLGQTCSEAFEIIISPVKINTGHVYLVVAIPVVTAGNFDGAVDATTGIATDELLIAGGAVNSQGISADVYRFDSDFTPVKGPNTLKYGNLNNVPYVASGRMDWSEQQEQAVIASVNQGSNSALQVLVNVVTFAADLTMTAHTKAVDSPSNAALFPLGVAAGRFDPPDISSGTADFDWQIATVNQVSTSSGETTRVDIFTIDPPSDFTPTPKSQYNVTTEVSKTVQGMIKAGDTQGRSLVLGEPDKATAIHIQPDTILGMPPQHLDFIEGLGGAAPSVLNLTVFPNTFNTAYNFMTTTGTQGSRKSTTSYTYSTKESAEEKVSYGVPDVDQVSVTLKQSATQTHDSTVSKNYNSYSGESFQLTAATEFDDKVIATSRQMNFYTYPVIGKFVCPFESPNCPDDCGSGPSPCPKQPLHIQYSGPDNVVHLEPTDAAGVEWYQGVEPGNIFSFPGSLMLLEATVPPQQNPSTMSADSRLQLLSGGDTAWGTQSTTSVSVDWTEGNGSQVTSGSVSTNSFDVSASVSGSTNIEGFGLSGSASFDYSQSTSASTVNSSSSTFSESTGITVHRGIGGGGGASSDEFLYEGQTYIFGQLAPLGTIQSDVTLDTTVKAQGVLRVGYAADPLSVDPVNSGDWWLQAYNTTNSQGVPLADVALIHPQRWLQNEPSSTSGQQVMFNCPVGFTSSFTTPECAPIDPTPPATPVAVTDALFYQMKGLFITPEGTTEGPPVISAPVGSLLNVAARIYNYSLATMPSGTEVHAAFYAQPWDANHGIFASQSNNPDAFAAATYIGEDVIAAIPPFCGGPMGGIDACSQESAPVNFATAQVQWDTTGLASETFWKIWVVVWMENGGALVPEINSHGLTAIPGTKLNSLADVPIETYSNNLGFYNQVFELTTPPSNTVVASEPVERTLTIEATELSKDIPLRNEIVTVRATHRAAGDHLDSVLALFYDGDPEADGKLFDMELIPRVPAGDVFVTPVPYRPRECGSHTLFIRSIPLNGAAAPASATIDFNVTIDTASALQRLIDAVKDLQLICSKKPQVHERLQPGCKIQDLLAKISLVLKLRLAEQSLNAGHTRKALFFLDKFNDSVEKLKDRGKIPADEADALIAQSKDLSGCVL